MSKSVKGDPLKDTQALNFARDAKVISKASFMRNLDDATLDEVIRSVTHLLAEAGYYKSIRNRQSKSGAKTSRKRT